MLDWVFNKYAWLVGRPESWLVCYTKMLDHVFHWGTGSTVWQGLGIECFIGLLELVFNRVAWWSIEQECKMNFWWGCWIEWLPGMLHWLVHRDLFGGLSGLRVWKGARWNVCQAGWIECWTEMLGLLFDDDVWLSVCQGCWLSAWQGFWIECSTGMVDWRFSKDAVINVQQGCWIEYLMELIDLIFIRNSRWSVLHGCRIKC